MKLSVKLLSGLALVALVAVAVIGLSNSASAAVDGKVYVTNSASLLTTESGSPAVPARKLATTVYGTYVSAATTGTNARDIVTNSDRFIVTVVDSDLNVTRVVTSGAGTTGYLLTPRPTLVDNDHSLGSNVLNIAGSGFSSPGHQVRVTLTQSTASPIIGAASTISVIYTGTSNVVTGVTVVGINFAGDGNNPPIITLGVNTGKGALSEPAGGLYNAVTVGRVDFLYSSSDKDQITASIKSVVDIIGSVITLTETARDSGRFEGTVLVKQRQDNYTAGTDTVHASDGGGTAVVPATIPAIGGPITIKYIDAVTAGSATNTARTATLSIDVTPPTASISAPVTASETQNRLPSYAGTVNDTESGLDVSTFKLLVDQNTDVSNTTMVVLATARVETGIALAAFTAQGTAASISTTSWVDGVKTQAWTHTQAAVLPHALVLTPNHLVDFQVQVRQKNQEQKKKKKQNHETRH